MDIGRLHILTDYHFQQRWTHWQLADSAIRGGADVIQFREKHGAIRHVLHEARLTVQRCRRNGIPAIINDRVDIALAAGADGVHLGQDDMCVEDARRILGDDAIVGATATTLEQARRAELEGASYIGFGPVFPTTSKANPASVKGLSALAVVCAAVRIPVVAIAGITADRVADVMSTGAHGIAVMTAVSLAPDPVQATQELAAAISEGLLV